MKTRRFRPRIDITLSPNSLKMIEELKSDGDKRSRVIERAIENLYNKVKRGR